MQSIDHVQLAIPVDGEMAARAFFAGVLGMTEIPKPEPLASRGGCWFRWGMIHLHCGVEKSFAPQRKAHPAFLVGDLDTLSNRLEQAGHPVLWDEALPDRRRFYTADPFGNRIELIAAGSGFSERD